MIKNRRDGYTWRLVVVNSVGNNRSNANSNNNLDNNNGRLVGIGSEN